MSSLKLPPLGVLARLASLSMLTLLSGSLTAWQAAAQTPGALFADGFESGDTCAWAVPECVRSVVFVSRQIPPDGTVYWNVPNDLPGVGNHSRFRVAAPGKLLVRAGDGSLRTLIDGTNPTAASLFLIDVNAPDVSYDGRQIVFAGLRAGSFPLGPNENPSAWRLYVIGIDGRNLRQLTFADEDDLDLSQFGVAAGGLGAYDDTDPVWLPDGRVAFASTRWRAFAHYSGVRVSNLYVVNADGSDLHRITAERNGADRPLVDPLTGKLVYARWWRNHRFATDSLTTVVDPAGGYRQHLGLTADRTNHAGGADNLWRNHWHLATIRPDGTGLALWAGHFRGESDNHFYGGGFTPSGELIANFFPMHNMTEAAGFGGLRRFTRGTARYQPLVGITAVGTNYVHPTPPVSYGVLVGNYAAEPAVLPDGRILFSWAADEAQEYGLYTMNADGTGRAPWFDLPGTSELRARVIASRPLPPVLLDSATSRPPRLPPSPVGPYDRDGVFTFDAWNVYANGPVDLAIVNAPAVGSAATIRFFLDHQRTSPGSFPNLDWPILLNEKPVSPAGAVIEMAPAHVPLFEHLRSAAGTVPLTFPSGAAHVTGMNFAPAGAVASCVGCHAGHTLIPLPASRAEAAFSNLAPGAQVAVSSTRDANQNRGLVDRRVHTGEIWRYWTSANGQTTNQWLRLTFPVPVTVREVRLYNPRPGDEAHSTLQVQGATVRLYSDAAATQEVAVTQVPQNLATSGTAAAFADVLARAVRVELGPTTGTFYGLQVTGLAEVEVIARGEAP